MQIDVAERGFSYVDDAPLDMRMDPRQELSAADVIATWDDAPPRARRCASTGRSATPARSPAPSSASASGGRSRRPPTSSTSSPARSRRPRASPAATPPSAPSRRSGSPSTTSCGEIDDALPLAWDILRENGRFAGISFQSLEDRRVKRFLADLAQGCICPPELPVCRCGRTPLAELLPRGGVVADRARGRREPARAVRPHARRAQAVQRRSPRMTPPPAATAAPRVGGTRRLARPPRRADPAPRLRSRAPGRRALAARRRGRARPAAAVRRPPPAAVRARRRRRASPAPAACSRGRGLIVVLAGHAARPRLPAGLAAEAQHRRSRRTCERAQALERDNAAKRTADLPARRRPAHPGRRRAARAWSCRAPDRVCYLDAGRTGARARAATRRPPRAPSTPSRETAPVDRGRPGRDARRRGRRRRRPPQPTPAPRTRPPPPQVAPAQRRPRRPRPAPRSRRRDAPATAPAAQAPADQTTAAGGIAAGGTP